MPSPKEGPYTVIIERNQIVLCPKVLTHKVPCLLLQHYPGVFCNVRGFFFLYVIDHNDSFRIIL